MRSHASAQRTGSTAKYLYQRKQAAQQLDGGACQGPPAPAPASPSLTGPGSPPVPPSSYGGGQERFSASRPHRKPSLGVCKDCDRCPTAPGSHGLGSSKATSSTSELAHLQVHPRGVALCSAAAPALAGGVYEPSEVLRMRKPEVANWLSTTLGIWGCERQGFLRCVFASSGFSSPPLPSALTL